MDTRQVKKYENVRLFPRSVFRRQRSRPMRVLWAPERTRCGRDSRGKRKERGAGETREVRGSSLSPLTFLHSRPVFLRLLCRPSFFVPLILLKKTSCGIRCLYFESTIHSFIFSKSQRVQRFENFIHMRFKWHRLREKFSI